jgi:hypothetical protein
MAYKFTFDISKLPKELFDEIANVCEKHLKIIKTNNIAIKLVKKFQIDKYTGLSFDESKTLIEDIIDIQIKNCIFKKYFIKANKKALFLPHCCRKYMDSNCQAVFQKDTSSYECRHCSEDCMVSQATLYAKKEGYDVYILPGASCLSKIFDKKRYEAIVGIACTDEIKLATKSLMKLKIPTLAIPLLKNGCSGTSFNFKTFKDVLKKEIRTTN